MARGEGSVRDAAPKDALKLVRRRHLELIVAAILGSLVEAPAHELRSMAEARALHVVVLHFADALWTQRLPGEIFAAVPATRCAGQALPFLVRFALRLRPVAPRM